MTIRKGIILAAGFCLLSAEPSWTGPINPNKSSSEMPTTLALKFSPDHDNPTLDTKRFLLSPKVVVDAKDSSLRLAHSVFLTDELGATDFHQTEELTDRIQAKKVFVLDSPEVTDAELFLFGKARDIFINGKPVSNIQKLPSTGWTRAKVAPGSLKAGDNEVTLKGGQLLIEPGKPGRSFKSIDSGKSWSRDALGKNQQVGEYLIRLRLGRYATHGWAQSQVIDLWASAPDKIATPSKLVAVDSLAGLSKGQPLGTKLTAFVRTGSTPWPDEENWTDWIALDKSYVPSGAASGHRWMQLQFKLKTNRPQATPRLAGSFHVKLRIEKSVLVGGKHLSVMGASGMMPLVRGSTPFIYQAPSARLELLRKRYKLDQVIAPGKTEMEQLMLLRHWVRNQWHTAWGSHPASWMPSWDALMILESKDQPDCLTMCTHYAAVFTQCCLALGWNARHCILDHHCVAEVWVEEHGKWVMMDAGNSASRPDCNLHFERDGKPLSARELHLAQRSGKLEGIKVRFTPAQLAAKITPLCRPAPQFKGKLPARPDEISLAELPKYPVCGLDNYRRYAFPGRNNYLSSLYPGELYQGWSEYYYDGYFWVGDSADEPRISPEYSRHLSPQRPQDVDWPLNRTRIYLCHTSTDGELQVDLETQTPNLARLQKSTKVAGKEAKGDWQTVPARFVWKLQPGENVLRVRSVNRWDRTGAVAEVRVQWKP
jgi:hypothetical protein